MVQRVWEVASPESGAEVELARALSCSPLLARLLQRRGIDDAEEAQRFLSPKLSDLHDPFLLPSMEKAAARVVTAVERKEKIAIFGDYDVDGVSSTSLLHEYFRFLGIDVKLRLPHRQREGYGLNVEALEELSAEGITLLITVDNGSAAVEEVDAARQCGIDVIVTDHHQPSEELPRAHAIVNPWLPGSEYPFKDLAGVGVAFKFIWALSQRLSKQTKLSAEFRDFLLDSLAYVALGTISDVVPLLGENRILAKFGLRALQTTQRAGLRSLVQSALRDSEKTLEASHVAFRIGPRLNAAGRLGSAEKALELLLCESPERAEELTTFLTRENERRRRLEAEIVTAAHEEIEKSIDLASTKVIVLAAEGWHPGVIGIVAARIVEAYYRPTLLISLDGESGRGSARSIPGVSICDALARCEAHLGAFGGHEMAAGVVVEASEIESLRAALQQAVERSPESMVPTLSADDQVDLGQLTHESIQELSRLQPFGAGNPDPLFSVEDVEIVGQPRILGNDGKHLAFHVRQENAVRRAIAFGKGELYPDVKRRGTRLSLLLAPQVSSWQGRSEVELNVRELRVLG